MFLVLLNKVTVIFLQLLSPHLLNEGRGRSAQRANPENKKKKLGACKKIFCTEEHYRPEKYADGQAILQWLVKPSESIQYMDWNLSDLELGKKVEIMRNWHELRNNFLHNCNKEE